MLRKDRSRSTSVPHVSAAMERQLRPSRGLPGGPLGTKRKVRAARLSSTSPMTTSARPHRFSCTPRSSMMSAPPTSPVVRMAPTRPLARPTCGSATRSGTNPWKGPCATFELTIRPRKNTTYRAMPGERAHGLAVPCPRRRLRHGDECEASEEQQVERGARDDVTLAPAEARGRVVTDGADGGHDGQGDEPAHELEDGDRRSLEVVAHEEPDLLLAEASRSRPRWRRCRTSRPR